MTFKSNQIRATDAGPLPRERRGDCFHHDYQDTGRSALACRFRSVVVGRRFSVEDLGEAEEEEKRTLINDLISKRHARLAVAWTPGGLQSPG